MGSRFVVPECTAKLSAEQWETAITIVEDGRPPRALVTETGRKKRVPRLPARTLRPTLRSRLGAPPCFSRFRGGSGRPTLRPGVWVQSATARGCSSFLREGGCLRET